ncbi:MAG: FlgO family outer membrane protein [Woeseiaceae bacterium]|nr:FlgO family outer membrane protein [Woeseiaceae bacterium]
MGTDRHSLLHGFLLDGWRVEPLAGTIQSPDGRSAHVTPKAMDVLVCLASRAGRTVERARIFEEVWGSLKHSEESLTHCVGELRKALGDKPEAPEFVQTVPRRGYRLVAAVSLVSESSATDDSDDSHAEKGFLDRQLGSLRRRKVFQAVLGYPVVAWVLAQIVDFLWEHFLAHLGAPEWLVPTIVVLLAVGYPITVFMAWAVDLTPEGVEVTIEEEGAASPLAGIAVLGTGSVALAALALVVYFLGYEPPAPPEPEPQKTTAVDEAPPKDSIAVLRFLNINDDQDIQYLADGLTEELIHELTNLGGLEVKSRTTIWHLPERGWQASEIAEHLDVELVLEGSVRSDQNNVRVTAQLIDRYGYHIWSEAFDTQDTGTLDIQKRVASLVVDELDLVLSDEDEERLARRPTSSSDAYDVYLRGRAHLRQPSTTETLTAAATSFSEAIDLDNRFSLAFAGMCEVHLADFRRSLDKSFFERAEIACHRALLLDDGLADVYTALGNLYRHFGEYEKAEQEYQAALYINPMMEEATYGLARAYQAMGRLALAEETILRTVVLEPGYWGSHFGVGNFLHRQGRHEEAIPYYEEVTRLKPDYAGGYVNLGSAHHWLGNWDEAERAFWRATELQQDSLTYQNLGTVMYFRHRFEEAVELYTKATEISPTDYRAWRKLASAQRWVPGLEDESIASFERAIELAREQLAINPDDGGVLTFLAYCLAETGRDSEAEETIERAIEILPEDAAAHYFAALILNRSGDTNATLTELEAAIEHGHSHRTLAADPRLENLHGLTRFQNLLQGRDSARARSASVMGEDDDE